MKKLFASSFLVLGLSSYPAQAAEICANTFTKNENTSNLIETIEVQSSPQKEMDLETELFDLQYELSQAAPKLKENLNQDPRYKRFLRLITLLLDKKGIQFSVSTNDSIQSRGYKDVITIKPIQKSRAGYFERGASYNADSANEDAQAVHHASTMLNNLAFKLSTKGFALKYYPELYIKDGVLGQYSSKLKEVSIELLDIIFGEFLIGETTLHEMSHLTTDEKSISSSVLRIKLEDKNESFYQIFSFDETLAHSKPSLSSILRSLSSAETLNLKDFIQSNSAVLQFSERMYKALLSLNPQTLGLPQKSYLTDTSLSIDFPRKRYAFFDHKNNDVLLNLDSNRIVLLPLTELEKSLLQSIRRSSSLDRSRKPSPEELQLINSVLNRISNIGQFNSMLNHELQSILSQARTLQSSLSSKQDKIYVNQLSEDQKEMLRRLILTSLSTTHNLRSLMYKDGTSRIPFEYRDFKLAVP